MNDRNARRTEWSADRQKEPTEECVSECERASKRGQMVWFLGSSNDDLLQNVTDSYYVYWQGTLQRLCAMAVCVPKNPDGYILRAKSHLWFVTTNLLTEQCSKLQSKLNGNFSSLREILAPSLRDHKWSLHAVNFSNWACATLRDLARKWIPEIWCVFVCAMQARNWFRTWVSWLLKFSASSVVSQLLDFLACPVASRLLGSN